jgi:hypothetical protein
MNIRKMYREVQERHLKNKWTPFKYNVPVLSTPAHGKHSK